MGEEQTKAEPGEGSDQANATVVPDVSRRELLKAAVGLGIGMSLAEGFNAVFAQSGQAATDPTTLPPQKGDWFVFADGQKKGQLVAADDLPLGGPQVLAWPAQVSGESDAPAVNVVRDGNQQNEVLLARFPVDSYSASTKGYVTAAGVVAYAATCTHQCCVVSDWNKAEQLFHCPCHQSEYDPLNNAEQTPESPAPRPLPQLPLVGAGADSSMPSVASGFRTQVGCGPITH